MPVKKRTAPDLSDYMDDPDELALSAQEEEEEEEAAPEPKKKPKKVKAEKKAKKPRRYDYDDDEEDDEVEEEPPAPKVRKRSEVTPKAIKRRRVVEDDEQDEDPDELPERSSVVQRGWAAARQRINETFTDDFSFTDDEQVVKFLDGDPLVYRQHWLKDKPGKKSYVCPEENCPLCEELGDEPANRFLFSVVNLSVEGYPVQKLSAGIRLANMLQKEHFSDRRGPLEKHYWALSKMGEKLSTVHKAELVKERDLEDDFGLDLDAILEALADREPLSPEKAVPMSKMSELQEVAALLS